MEVTAILNQIHSTPETQSSKEEKDENRNWRRAVTRLILLAHEGVVQFLLAVILSVLLVAHYSEICASGRL